MKKIIVFSLLFTLSCSSLFADNDSGKKKNTDWFVGVGAGFNVAFDGMAYSDRRDTHIGAGTALDVYFGKFFNNAIGFRAGYHGLTTSNQFRGYGKDNFNYVHADLLFRPSNYVLPYVHLGLDNFKYFAGGAGLMLQIPVGKRIQIVPDVKATLFSSDAFDIPEKKCAVNISGTIGIKVSLGKKGSRSKAVEEPVMEPVVEPVVEPVEEPAEELAFAEPKKDTVINTPVSSQDTVAVETDVCEHTPESVVFFDLNKSTLASKESLHLQVLVHNIQQCITRDGKVTLVGSADRETGSHRYNHQLALARVGFVKSVLMSKYGLQDETIETVSEGDTNNRYDSQEMNRCVYVSNYIGECPPEPIVFFDINKSKLDSKEISHLKAFVHRVQQAVAQNGRVTLVGSADRGTGSAQYNYKLALERAELVKSVLVTEYGIDAAAIDVVSEGDTNNRFDTLEMNRCVYVRF